MKNFTIQQILIFAICVIKYHHINKPKYCQRFKYKYAYLDMHFQFTVVDVKLMSKQIKSVVNILLFQLLELSLNFILQNQKKTPKISNVGLDDFQHASRSPSFNSHLHFTPDNLLGEPIHLHHKKYSGNHRRDFLGLTIAFFPI